MRPAEEDKVVTQFEVSLNFRFYTLSKHRFA